MQFLRISIIFFSLCWSVDQDGSIPNLFDNQVLAQKDHIADFLKQEGFKSYWITTQDGYHLDSLFLRRTNAVGTFIVCGGLCCIKESMATLYALIPTDYNILFFDARGHGNSSGSLLYKPWHYGIHEYKDILAILDFVYNQTHAPIILYGNCAGGFNALHALLYLHYLQKLSQYQVKGFIFDSGWASRLEASHSATYAKLSRLAKKLIISLLGSPLSNIISNSFPSLLLDHMTRGLLGLMHSLVYKPLLLRDEESTNLYNKIAVLHIPMLFIHSVDDTWVAFNNIEKLSKKAYNAFTWWIQEHSHHSCHHIIYPSFYREKITHFCNTYC